MWLTSKEKIFPSLCECNVMAPNHTCDPETVIRPKVKAMLKVVVIFPAKIKWRLFMILKLFPSAHEYICFRRELSLTPPHEFHHFPYRVPSELCAHDLKVLRRDNMGVSTSNCPAHPFSFKSTAWCFPGACPSRGQLRALRLGFFRNFLSSSQSLVFLRSGAIRKMLSLHLSTQDKLTLQYLWP